jgi:hypothetical protein
VLPIQYIKYKYKVCLTDKNHIIKTNLDKITVFYYKNICPDKMLNVSTLKDRHRGQNWKGKQQNALNYGFCEKYEKLFA